jgi:hemoglobin
MKTKLISIKMLLALLIICFCVITSKSFSQESTAKATLYSRLGGYDAIASVTDDFITKLMNEPQLSKFFVGFSNDSKMRIRQHIIDFICQETGGPCYYTGKDIKTMHRGLGISESEWGIATTDFKGTLDKFNVGQKEQEELLSAISSMKNDIVEK